MPIMVTPGFDRASQAARVVRVNSVPWAMFVTKDEEWSQTNHHQSLEEIASRGGFGAKEMLAVLAGVRYRAIEGLDDETAHRLLYRFVSTFNRGQRVAEARSAEFRKGIEEALTNAK